MSEGLDTNVINIEDSFPEIMKHKDLLFKLFGIKYEGTKIVLGKNGYGYSLAEFINKIMALFEMPVFREACVKFVKKEFPEGIPNLREEWVKVRIEGLRQNVEYGKDALKVLETLASFGETDIATLSDYCGLKESTLRHVLALLKIYHLIVEPSSNRYRLADEVIEYKYLIG